MKKICWNLIELVDRLGLSAVKISLQLFSIIGKLIKWTWGKVASIPTRIPPGIPTLFLGALIVSGAVFGAIAGGVALWNSEIPLLVRDANIAIYAHHMKGEEIPVVPDYIDSVPYYPGREWGVITNSEWLWDYARNIVPYFEYEGLTANAVYPVTIIFSPTAGIRSMKVGGWAWPPQRIVYVNERSITVPHDPANQGDLVSTLTHELIHIQGGHFFDCPEEIGSRGSRAWSQWIESHTETATTEVLAGMCIYDDAAACYGFWDSIESFARSSLKLRFMRLGIPGAYEGFANLFLRDASEEAKSRKSIRYWASHQGEMIDILEKYYQSPWEEFVIPGVIFGISLDTGILDCESNSAPYESHCRVLGMKFDDTEDLIGPIKWLMYLGY